MPMPHCLDYCSFIISLEIRQCKTTNFLLFKALFLQLFQVLHIFCQLCSLIFRIFLAVVNGIILMSASNYPLMDHINTSFLVCKSSFTVVSDRSVNKFSHSYSILARSRNHHCRFYLSCRQGKPCHLALFSGWKVMECTGMYGNHGERKSIPIKDIQIKSNFTFPYLKFTSWIQ